MGQPTWVKDHVNRKLESMADTEAETERWVKRSIYRVPAAVADLNNHHGKIHIMPFIKRDMLMLENQLPMHVLHRLVAVDSNGTKDIPGRRRRKQRYKPSSSYHEDGDDIIRSATELNEAGIRFKKSKSVSLKDIEFCGGILRLLVIIVDDATESMFLNLIAFERFHVGAGNEVTSYTFFMDNIVDNGRDVALLHSRGIIQNALGSDKAVTNLFNSLSKDSSLNEVQTKVSKYCKKAWNEWRANLIHSYYRNPWAILSLIAALFLFALTVAQTVYTIYPYYQESPTPPPPPPPTPPKNIWFLHNQIELAIDIQDMSVPAAPIILNWLVGGFLQDLLYFFLIN
ncbi:hypothetical protein V6N13_043717 [Hibiscus sabdariffa]